MASKAFKKIMAGLQDMRAHLIDGDESRAREIARAPVLTDIDVARLRKELGLSQSEFAHGFGVSLRTLQDWEQGRRRPEGPAKVLLSVIRRNPRAVFDSIRPVPRRKSR
jgi:putative transcriptional regulator